MDVRKIKRSGFSLIELVVVIVIIGLLATYIAPKILDKPKEARIVKAGIDIKSIETALSLYKIDNGLYPTTEQGLKALIEKPTLGNIPKNWNEEGYMDKTRLPKDPWGNEYKYLSPGLHGKYDISSYGADGEKGGTDEAKDINNWELE
ncbi:MAG: type II secretion system major pseudopilin GspG [Nitrospinota bacterium]